MTGAPAGYSLALDSPFSLVSLLGFLDAQQVRPIEESAAPASKEPGVARGVRAISAHRSGAWPPPRRRLMSLAPPGSWPTTPPTATSQRVDHRRYHPRCAGRGARPARSGAGQYFVAALRAFLRFAHVEGLIAADLSAAALAVTGRRAPAAQGHQSEAEAARLLRSL